MNLQLHNPSPDLERIEAIRKQVADAEARGDTQWMKKRIETLSPELWNQLERNERLMEFVKVKVRRK